MSIEKKRYNLIVTGVGGQGNVVSSQLIGKALVRKGYFVTIGETYGSSQRGGAVMSHIRISGTKQLSPLIPKGKADIIVALEPVEALRVLAPYGNPDVVALVNTRPVYPIDVTAGNATYPEIEKIKRTITSLTRKAYYLDATDRALQMGNPILGNMIMIGALVELKLIPFSYEDFTETLSVTFDKNKLNLNIQALDEGRRAITHSLRESN